MLVTLAQRPQKMCYARQPTLRHCGGQILQKTDLLPEMGYKIGMVVPKSATSTTAYEDSTPKARSIILSVARLC